MKPHIRDRLGVTVFKTVNEAKNLALRAELMIQEQSNRFGGGRKNYGYDSVCSSNRVVGEKNKGVVEKFAGGVEKKDDKAEGKKLMEPTQGKAILMLSQF